MNVLVVGVETQFGSIYPLAVNGLRRNGCRATGISYRGYYFNLTTLARLLCKCGLNQLWPLGYSLVEQAMTWQGDRRCQRLNRERILAELDRDRYDVLLVIRGDAVTRETIAECQRRHPGLQTAIWFLDHPLVMFTTPPQVLAVSYAALAAYDLICCFDDYYLDGLQALTGKPTLHLPLAYDEEQFYPLGVKRELGAGLVGSVQATRLALLRQLPEVTVSGPGWPADLPVHRRGVLDAAAVNRLYNETRINLNLNHPQSVWDYNNKLFEITGSGGFLLTDCKRNLDRHFVVGREVETFRTEAELRAKLAYYREHPDEAERIARAGHERAVRDHTYRVRMRTLLDELARLRAARTGSD